MKVLKKNVYTAEIRQCTEYTTKLVFSDGDTSVGDKSIKYSRLHSNEVFIKIDSNTYVQARDLYNQTKGYPTIAKAFVLKMPMQKFTTAPHQAGDIYIYNLEHSYSLDSDEKIDLADVMIDYYKQKADSVIY